MEVFEVACALGVGEPETDTSDGDRAGDDPGSFHDEARAVLQARLDAARNAGEDISVPNMPVPGTSPAPRGIGGIIHAPGFQAFNT